MKVNWKKVVPCFLTVTSCVGVVGVAITSGRDTIKAKKKLETKEISLSDKKSVSDYLEIVKETLPCYIPTVAATAITISAIIFNKQLTKKQMLAIVGAGSASGRFIGEMNNKIRELYGEDVLDDIRREIAKDHEDGIPYAAVPDISYDSMLSRKWTDGLNGDTLFYDSYYDIWFRSSMAGVISGVYHLNRNHSLGAIPTLEMLYEFWGVSWKDQCDEDFTVLGWGEEMYSDGIGWIDVSLTPSEKKDTGENYYIINYEYPPVVLEEVW